MPLRFCGFIAPQNARSDVSRFVADAVFDAVNSL
jgi:hypothetical protein